MVFKSKAALERYIKALLIEVPAGAELTGEAEEIVTDLINHHPKAAEKIQEWPEAQGNRRPAKIGGGL
jgi:HEPN domain-containing protein